MCRSCLKDNSPRVKKDCVDWLNDDSGVDTSGWVMDDLMNDNGVPQTDNEGYAVMFKNYPGGVTEDHPIDTRSCWQPRGAGDKQVVDYAEKCFEVLSWCNLLCPRHPADRRPRHVQALHPVRLRGRLLGHRQLQGWPHGRISLPRLAVVWVRLTVAHVTFK